MKYNLDRDARATTRIALFEAANLHPGTEIGRQMTALYREICAIDGIQPDIMIHDVAPEFATQEAMRKRKTGRLAHHNLVSGERLAQVFRSERREPIRG